jgi:hypothetical protein
MNELAFVCEFPHTGSDSISTHPAQVSQFGGDNAVEPFVSSEPLVCEDALRFVPFFGGMVSVSSGKEKMLWNAIRVSEAKLEKSVLRRRFRKSS